MKKNARNMAYSAILAALVTVFVVLGGVLDVLDLTSAAVSALILCIVADEMGNRRALLIYLVSAALSLILMPGTTATVYFVFFFGYYPVLRTFLNRVLAGRKGHVFAILFDIYNLFSFGIYFFFKKLFGMENDPLAVKILYFVVSDAFFCAFELLCSRIYILYRYKIKNRLFPPKP